MTSTPAAVAPCRKCGAPCSIQTFGPSDHIEQPFDVWICSYNWHLGGKCTAPVSLTEADWRQRNGNPPTPSLECPSCHGLNLSCPDGCGRDPATGELNGTKLVPTPSPVSGEVTRDKLVRLLYDAWPNTVFSQHLSDLTGLPIDSVLDFDSAAKAGATFGGIERYADVILPLFAATAQAGEVERLREAITPSGDTKAAYMGEFSFTIMQTEEDEDGDMVDRPVNVLVPWTTIKEIMAAIGARALASGDVAKGEG